MAFNRNQLLIGTVPPPPGGDATWSADYLSFYEELGVSVPLIDTSIIGKRANTIDENRNIIDELKRCFSIWTSLRKQIKKNRPSIIHMNINCSPLGSIRDYVTARIIRFKKIPFIVHCHCNIQDQIGEKKLSLLFLKRLFNLSNRIIVINNVSLGFAKKLTQTNTVMIPNFVKNIQSQSDKVLAEKVQNILFVGHIRRTKGIDEIIQASTLLDQYQFVLVGPITEDYPEYKQGMRINNLHFLGNLPHDDVIKQLDKADVFLFPSYTEGFSISLVEAMSRGLPCIVSNVGANEEMVEDKGGIVIPPNDTQSIVDALKKLESVETRSMMSAWNIEKVEKCYRIENVMQQLEKVYCEVIDESY